MRGSYHFDALLTPFRNSSGYRQDDVISQCAGFPINVQRNEFSCPLKISLGHLKRCHVGNMRQAPDVFQPTGLF